MFIKKIWSKIFYLKNKGSDQSGRELILLTLLSSSIICFTLLNIVRLIDVINNPHDRGLPIIYTLIILALFIFLFYLVRRGFLKISSYILIFIYAAPTIYSFLNWGTDLPAALLLAILVLTLSGVLLGANAVLTSTSLLICFLLITTYFQENGTIKVISYWRNESNEFGDVIAYSIILFVIAIIAWLFCREIKKALIRARKSEAELKEERDALEIKVIERSAQIRSMEMEKISQLYRLAEFGRLSSGIFHDLINPLTAVSLNLEQVRIEGEQKLLSAKSYLNQAILATNKMENLIISIKKQIQKEGGDCSFPVNKEIQEIIEILSYKSRKANTIIRFETSSEFNLYGDPIKFSQIISNLLANAIEACEKKENLKNQKNNLIIKISLKQIENNLNITISDPGIGIPRENISKIFDTFFSTKSREGRGLGIGLASTKNIIEKNFQGTIRVESEINNGTKFTITLPYEKK
jgi:signal transduction histidine kinase